MPELHLPWLELACLAPLLGAIVMVWLRDPEQKRVAAIIASGFSLFFAMGAWEDFGMLAVHSAHDRWDLFFRLFGTDSMVIDELSAPLLPLSALMFFITAIATLRTKVRRFPFALNLVQEFLLLTMLACRQPWGIVVLLAAQTVPVWMELRARGQSTRVFAIHMVAFVGLLVAGLLMIDINAAPQSHSPVAIAFITLAILIRCGCVPLHCWMTDLFEKATLGTAILFVTPLPGAYAVVRLVLPVSPDWALRMIALVSMLTAVYAAGMALVQNETRRFYCYLLLGNAALVTAGLEVVTVTGFTGALCGWISAFVTLTGLGLSIRAIESRVGRLSLRGHHGLYTHMPLLATFFLVSGLASAGFPGTIGFVGIELLVEGAVQVYPAVGMLIVLATAMNGIAILHGYFRLFTGTVHVSTFPMTARLPERIVVLVLTALIFGLGLVPQPGVFSRYQAAKELGRERIRSGVSIENEIFVPVSGLENGEPAGH